MKRKPILFADCPPSPLDREALRLYADLGFNTFLLTEDDAHFTEDGKITEKYEKSLQNLDESGLNIWIRNMYNDPDYFVNPSFRKGSNYGSAYEIEKRNITNEFSSHPSVTGFYMADEPFMKKTPDHPEYASFDQLTHLVDWKNRFYPDAYFHMNMVPSSSWDHYYAGGTKLNSYADFIQSYIDVIVEHLPSGGRSVCLDNYPFVGDKYIEPSYLPDLLTAANLTRDYNRAVPESVRADFGLCIQTFLASSPNGDGRKRDILLPEEVTFQLFCGAALGARVFEYFCYRSLPAYGLMGIMNNDHEGRIYGLVKKANETAMPMLDELSAFEWVGAFACQGTTREFSNPLHLAKDLYLSKTSPLESISSTYDCLVGKFENASGYAFVLVNYTDPQKNHVNDVNLTFNGAPKVTRLIPGGAPGISSGSSGMVLKLQPGEAVLIETEK